MKNKSKPKRKYKWYVVDSWTEYVYRDDYQEHIPNVNNFKIIRATDKKHAETSKHRGPYNFGYQNESFDIDLITVIKEFETKKEAETYLKKLQMEADNDD